MIEKIIKNINILIIILIIFASGILIGTPLLKENVQIIYIAIGIFSVFYFLKRIIKKEEIIHSKIDILISILIFSTLLPLLFRTYASLSETVYNILKYFCILDIYLIAKNECRKNEKYKDIVINSIIITILLLCVIGIDEVNANFLKGFKEFIHFQSIEYDEIRISSLFSYPNAMAAVSGLGFFLCLGYIFDNTSKKVKVIYSIIALIMLITLVLTYSRLVYIIFILALILYCLMLCKKYKIKEKINTRVIVALLSVLILGIIYVIIGLQIPDKLTVKNEYQKILYSVKPNEDYVFSFDINSESDKEESIIINFIEKNKFFDDINTTQVKLGTYVGNKEIKVHTNESTSVMYIKVEIKENCNTSFTISSAAINNKQLILKYKLLPTNIVNKIQGISLNNKSTWERFTFIKNGLNIIKDNWIVGKGGSAWETLQYNVQDYNYFAKEMHSFPIQLWIENGILAFISYVGIVICILYKFYISLKDNELNMKLISNIVAIIFIQLHCLLDFDMSFFYVQLIVFLIIAVLNDENKEINTKKAVNIIINCIIIVISLITITICSVKKYYNTHTSVVKVDSIWTEERIFDIYNRLLPFDKNVNKRRYKALLNCKSDNEKVEKSLKNMIIYEYYDDENVSLDNAYIYTVKITENINNSTNEKLDFVLEYVQNTEKHSIYRADFQIARFRNLNSIIRRLEMNQMEEYKEKFQNQLDKEIKEKEEYILDFTNSRYPKENVENYKRMLESFKK